MSSELRGLFKDLNRVMAFSLQHTGTHNSTHSASNNRHSLLCLRSLIIISMATSLSVSVIVVVELAVYNIPLLADFYCWDLTLSVDCKSLFMHHPTAPDCQPTKGVLLEYYWNSLLCATTRGKRGTPNMARREHREKENGTHATHATILVYRYTIARPNGEAKIHKRRTD